MTDFDQRQQRVGTQYNADTINQNIGVPYEQYTAELAKKEIEYRELLVSSTITEQEKVTLSIQIKSIEEKRHDEQASYKAHIHELKKQIKRLDQLKGQLPEKSINDAKQALVDGDNSKAIQLFNQIKEQANRHIAIAAEADFQLGKISEEDFDFRQAIKHYHQATHFLPDNSIYLEAAGSIAMVLKEYQTAIEYYKKALQITIDNYGEKNSKVASISFDIGWAYLILGDVSKGSTYYEQSKASDFDTFKERAAFESEGVVSTLFGKAALDKGDFKEAFLYFEASLADNYGSYDKGIFNKIDALVGLATTCSLQGDHQKTITYCKQALEHTKKVAEEGYETESVIWHLLGEAWFFLDDYQKAISYYEQCLPCCIKRFGKEHCTVTSLQDSLGHCWSNLDQHQKAIEYYDQVLVSYLKTYGEGHHKVAEIKVNIGTEWSNIDEYQKAIDYFELALASYLKKDNENHAVDLIKCNLGICWLNLGEYQKAIVFFEQALASHLSNHGEDHLDVAKNQYNLGYAWDSLGEYQKAIGYFEQALTITRNHYGDEAQDVLEINNTLNKTKDKLNQ